VLLLLTTDGNKFLTHQLKHMTQTAKYLYQEEQITLQASRIEKGAWVPVAQQELFSNVSPLYYERRVRLTFEISHDKANLFALIKGMIEFHRTNRFQFRYDKSQNSIETDIAIESLGELHNFLRGLDTLIQQEIQFKNSLRQVISFENKYKTLADSFYSGLMAAAK